MTHDNNAELKMVAAIEYDLELKQSHFDRFADLSGDHNPIHVDPDYAASTRFGATVPHGMMLFSLLRSLIEDNYPGATLLSQDLKFPAPVHAGEWVTLRLGVYKPPPGDGLRKLLTVVENEEALVCLEGYCLLKFNPSNPETFL